MVEIDLDKKDNKKYSGQNETVEVKSTSYLSTFQKITYEIKYTDEHDTIWFFWYSTYFTVYIKHNSQTIFTYYTSKNLDLIFLVESYHSNTCDNVPLILGLKNKYYTRYYTLSSLKTKGSLTGFPDKGEFKSGQLNQQLKAEDNRVNRIKFLNTTNGYKNCKEERKDVEGHSSVKHCYTVDNDKRYYDHYLDKYEIFKHESAVIEVNESYFKTVDNQYFDEVCVYCTNEQIKRVLLLEFINGNTKTYFSRQDKYGYYWVEKKGIDKVQTELQKIETGLNDKITFILSKKSQSYGLGSINVTKGTLTYYNKYTHTPQNAHTQKKSYIINNGNLITLKSVNEITGNRLSDPQNQTYSSVTTFFKKSSGREVEEPPFFLELAKSVTNKYYFQRVDNEGIKWTQTNVTSDNLKEQGKKDEIFKQVDYYSNKSIVILANENKNTLYNVNIINNSSNEKSEQAQKMPVQAQDCVTGSSYKSYKHDLSNVTSPRLDVNPLSSVNGLRLFIGSNSNKNVNIDPFLEIKPYDSLGAERMYLYFDVSKGDKNNIYVYLLKDSNVPLMFYYSENFHFPKSMDEYFTKWVEITDLKFVKPCESSSSTQIKTQLDKVNKNLNQIDLSRTTFDGYGIKKQGQTDKDYYTLPDNRFEGKRINLTNGGSCDKFCKLTHKTVNNQSIGKLIYNGNDLQEDGGKKILQAVQDQRRTTTFNSLSAYYHKSDKTSKLPLLIGIYNSGEQNNKVFYYRVDSSRETKWKKVEVLESQNLQKEDDKLVDKINTIRYNIGKSIVIQVDQQDKGGSDNSYQVKLVENKDGTEGTTQSAGTNYQITVSKKGCSKPDLKGYICFTHTIPETIGSTSSEDTGTNHYISGLRVYACDKYLETKTSTGSHNLPIYYESGKNEVKVYFYQHGSSGTSTNPDKVPLLVEYGGTHYKPSSRDSYFNSWVTVQVLEEARGDSLEKQGQPLQEVLDVINKNLNTIELDRTGNGSDGEKYGIKEPSLSTGNCCSKTPVKEFCQRVTVKRETSHKEHYLMVTHKTNNKGPIGPFKYREQTISGIKTSELGNGCNQVHVYYRVNDSTYSHPLLIRISYQAHAGVITCTEKWFSRQGIEINNWNEQDNRDGKFSTDGKIKDELEKIQAKLSNYLNLDISKQSQYLGCVQKGSESKDKQNVGQISVEGVGTGGSYRVANYRIYEHYLYSYYEENKSKIKSQLKLDTEDPTLQVRIYIDSIYINILGTTGDKLTYGKTEARRSDSNDPYVYFYEPDTYATSSETDWVPLLFKYGDRYFVPSTKADYFKNWKEVTISGGDFKSDIKNELDRINCELNEIDLNKKDGDAEQDYGLPSPGSGVNSGQFKIQRIRVTRSDNKGTGPTKYTTVKHKTVNNYNIGSIKPLGKCTFDNTHTTILKDKQVHNEAVAVYCATDIRYDCPLIVLVAEHNSRGGGPTVWGYYLTRECTSGGKVNYNFKTVSGGFNLAQIDIKEDGKSARKTLKDQNEELYNNLKTFGVITNDDTETPLGKPGQQGSDVRGNGVEAGKESEPGGNRLNHSGGMGAGEKTLEGPQGPPGSMGQSGQAGLDRKQGEQGPESEPGRPGSDRQPDTQIGRTEATTTSPGLETTSRSSQGTQQPQQPGGGGEGDGGPNGGGASPDSERGAKGDRGDAGPQGLQGTHGSSSGSSDSRETPTYLGEKTIDKIIDAIVKAPKDHPAEFYGGTGSVGGVGVIGTVGAVVYKK